METTGQRERETIQRVVRQHRREIIKYCYEKELQTTPGLEGRVVVEFTIAPSGEVVAALVDQSTLGNAEVENCMQNKIRHWTFPPVDDVQMAKVSYPFNFSPE
jgi:TonB family protein